MNREENLSGPFSPTESMTCDKQIYNNLTVGLLASRQEMDMNGKMTNSGADLVVKSRLDSMPDSTEVVIMVDKDDNEIGTCTRKEMRQFNKWHRTTCTVILAHPQDPHVFYHVRDSVKEYCPGYYDLGFGGVVTVGESYLDNAMRETAEECGLTLEPEHLVELGSFSRDDEWVRCHYRVYVALYNGEPEQLIPQKGEVERIGKVKLSELEQMIETMKFTNSCETMFGFLKNFITSGKMSTLKEAKMVRGMNVI
ncbi:bifunctional NUDIX hydrolase domain/NUDIX hydrolase-like domain superfamily [Babesia duncani]|uniref:Bifunctional NUDIX hydrolase domain/NUDIX hydrolase-like domain superfamily n=1 Tax=Babesia duncani TaxID=323732 RepID=A0AAD9PJT0_9APIC|nr:bifunctional NUDIX hydrolase domain/NUDIX hydrolase-like domain superfamily [Babesia duncani]KAK2194744.1 bifunctional NUDIX hydrolase domain/NUDIX hydrolase-like domain superfamily [Babesia duncani]KAK2195891.1 bifunctional NUDIX hydrolase domain/NUDIX hydrolase-like domain superfamily [Babesia duncani]